MHPNARYALLEDVRHEIVAAESALSRRLPGKVNKANTIKALSHLTAARLSLYEYRVIERDLALKEEPVWSWDKWLTETPHLNPNHGFGLPRTTVLTRWRFVESAKGHLSVRKGSGDWINADVSMTPTDPDFYVEVKPR